MAKIEHGSGILLSIDTEKRTLKFQEIRRVGYSGQPPPKEWEHPHGLEWEDQKFYDLVGEDVEYVLSDGIVVNLKSEHR